MPNAAWRYIAAMRPPQKSSPGKPLPPPKRGRRQARTAAPAVSANPHPARAAAAKGGREPQRIAKLLARAGIASRREIERMI